MWGNWYWPVWLSAVALTFLGPELYAVATDVKNTLSWYCWRELHIDVVWGGGIHSVAWWNSLLAFILIIVALIAHIWWKAVL